MHDLIILIKRTLWDRKDKWLSLALKDLPDELRKLLQLAAIATGSEGIWISPYATDSQGQVYYLMSLDVEDPDEHHTSIKANIDTAIELFIRLTEMGLTQDLVIFLTGNGFRFCWPYLIGPDWSQEFLMFISDHETFPGIDPSPQEKNTPIRFAAYRGNSKQNKVTADVHTYRLPQASDILELNKDKYTELVRGKPNNPDQYFEDLKLIIPTDLQLPKQWIALFKYYRTIIRLRAHIVKIGFYNNQNHNLTNWPLIQNHLDKLGIEATELQVGETRIFRLSTCPECEKREGSPFLTMSGRLKCFRATCPGSKSRQCGTGGPYWAGLAPWEWVEHYQPEPGNEEEATEYKGESFCSIKTAREIIKEALYNV